MCTHWGLCKSVHVAVALHGCALARACMCVVCGYMQVSGLLTCAYAESRARHQGSSFSVTLYPIALKGLSSMNKTIAGLLSAGLAGQRDPRIYLSLTPILMLEARAATPDFLRGF